MFVLAPIQITDSVLTASNLPEDDHPVWSPTLPYAAPNRVISLATHRIYEATGASTGVDPVANVLLPANDPARRWVEVSATNRWRAFDQSNSAAASNAGDITYTLTLPALANGLALLRLAAASVTVDIREGSTNEVVVSETLQLYDTTGIVDWYTFFTWDPSTGSATYQTEAMFLGFAAYAGYRIDITVSGAEVKVGEILVGQNIEIGTTVAGTRIGYDDFSSKTRDEFGNIKLVVRDYADYAVFRFMVPVGDESRVRRTLASLRGIPAIYYSSETSLNRGAFVYGISTGRVRVVLEAAGYSTFSLETMGLT